MTTVPARAVLALALLLAAPRLRAGPTPADIAEARRLFSEAVALEQAASWSPAAEKLQRALAIKETPGLRFHLAYCEEQAGALVLASRDYQRARELITGGANAPDVEPLLSLAHQRISARLARLTLVVAAGVEPVSVVIDGNPFEPALLGKSFPIDPGRHRITLKARRHRELSTAVEIRTGESRTLELTLEPLSRKALLESSPLPLSATAGVVGSPEPSASPTVAVEPSSFGTREVLLITEGTLAIAGLGVGIGYALERRASAAAVQELKREVDRSSGTRTNACEAALVPNACADLGVALGANERAATLSVLGFVGAGVSAAAFALTWALWPSSQKAVAIELTPRGSGFDVRAEGRF